MYYAILLQNSTHFPNKTCLCVYESKEHIFPYTQVIGIVSHKINELVFVIYVQCVCREVCSYFFFIN